MAATLGAALRARGARGCGEVAAKVARLASEERREESPSLWLFGALATMCGACDAAAASGDEALACAVDAAVAAQLENQRLD